MQSSPVFSNNPIVIVEDDADDNEILKSAFKEIGVKNEFRCFDNAVKAIEYLRATSEVPFLIISDINLPMIDGFKFRSIINEDPTITSKRIPFVFLSTSKENNLLEKACNLSIQGYFRKPDDIESLKSIARAIVEYWKDGVFYPPAN